MNCYQFSLVIILFSLLSFSLSSAQLTDFRFKFCNDGNGNYTNSSTFSDNLDALLSNMISSSEDDNLSNTIGGGFYNLTAGGNTGVDKVNGIALCRGDLAASDCRSCISDAAKKIREVCPNEKEAVGWYNGCMVRYSNRSIFGSLEASPTPAAISVANSTDPAAHDEELGTLLQSLQTKAAAGDSRRKFADGTAKVSSFERVSAYVECTPDLSGSDCSSCISMLISTIPNCCGGKKGAFIANPSCNIRFDNFQFYNSPTNNDSQPPSPSSPSNGTDAGKGKGGKDGKVVIAIVVPTVICAILVALIFWWCIFRRKRWQKFEPTPSVGEAEDDIKSIDSLQFAFRTIRAATDDFSDLNKLGRGGFGAVYKGTLSNGQEIAVKRLAKASGQGELEFKNEVLLVAKLQHRNLARLLGFCLEREERLLIYECVANRSLDHFLFDPVKRKCLDWHTRYQIITGIARGMLYLHEDSRLRIIHRDLKASNILLDAEMNPKISDFGMAKLFHMDQTQGDTNRVVGTYGYMAPEYALHGLFSAKSDVYSFGVIVLEMITGRRSIGFNQAEDPDDLINLVWRRWREGTPMSIVDETISTGPRADIMRCIHIGLLCVQEDAADRPTMSSVVVMLSSHSYTLPLPSHPALVTHTHVPLRRHSEERSSGRTVSNGSKSKSMNRSENMADLVSESQVSPR